MRSPRLVTHIFKVIDTVLANMNRWHILSNIIARLIVLTQLKKLRTRDCIEIAKGLYDGVYAETLMSYDTK